MAEGDDNVGSIALCGMTDAQITAKHRRLRGSDALKYPPPHLACIEMCGLCTPGHRCFLMAGHTPKDIHEFSSVCLRTEERYAS